MAPPNGRERAARIAPNPTATRAALTEAQREAIREQVRAWPPLTGEQVATVVQLLAPETATSRRRTPAAPGGDHAPRRLTA
jgi:D-aminopeptidase